VAEDEPLVEQAVRQPDDRWGFTATAGSEAAVSLSSIRGEAALAEIYDKVELPGGEGLRLRAPARSSGPG
jgi:hypothetical protein